MPYSRVIKKFSFRNLLKPIGVMIQLIEIPGVGLENKGHQGSHFFNFKGKLKRHVQIQLQRGIKCVFIVMKELKGLLYELV